MAEETWRDIPVKDLKPLLESCSPEQMSVLWDLWREIDDKNTFENNSLLYRSLLSVMAYLLTASMVALTPEQERKSDVDAFYDANKTLLDILFTRGANDYKYYLGYNTTYNDGETKHTTAPRCYNEIFKFANEEKDVSQLILGLLIDKFVNYSEQNKNLRSLNEGELKKLEDHLTGKDLYKIWRAWRVLISFEKKIRGRLQNGVRQIIFNGAPGTGKSYISERLATSLGSMLPGEDKPYVRVQFHPSYDYTDFVEGLRPVMRKVRDEEVLAYVKLDGHFKSFCRRVIDEGSDDKNYFFLIDEINRADLSKVFGELMYCLDSDKRGAKHPVKTQYQNLPTYAYDSKADDYLAVEDGCFAKGFYIPENVYILGTMNDIDRSVESMDFALRRRFEFIEIEVTEELLESALVKMGFSAQLAESLAKSVSKLNGVIKDKGIKYGLSRHYFISQGQFANMVGRTSEESIRSDVWHYRIKPLLQEYLRGEEGVDAFIEECRKEGGFPEKEIASDFPEPETEPDDGAPVNNHLNEIDLWDNTNLPI